VVVEAVASMHFDYIAEAAGPDTTVLVFVETTGWEALSQRAVEQGRSLLESSSWSGGKRYAGRRGLKRQMDPGGLEELVRLAIGEQKLEMHTRDL
jgi:hypothetical protein